jgi:hypothetical protein
VLPQPKTLYATPSADPASAPVIHLQNAAALSGGVSLYDEQLQSDAPGAGEHVRQQLGEERPRVQRMPVGVLLEPPAGRGRQCRSADEPGQLGDLLGVQAAEREPAHEV